MSAYIIQDTSIYKTITCRICDMGEHLDGRDLETEFHRGFTVGRGKRLYWYITWHRDGNCTVYGLNDNDPRLTKRWLRGDTEITVHFVI